LFSRRKERGATFSFGLVMRNKNELRTPRGKEKFVINQTHTARVY
jgi:hypothetical protein